MEEASIEDIELLEAVYEYIISLKYSVSCSENRKRAIRRKAIFPIDYKNNSGSLTALHYE